MLFRKAGRHGVQFFLRLLDRDIGRKARQCRPKRGSTRPGLKSRLGVRPPDLDIRVVTTDGQTESGRHDSGNRVQFVVQP
jgi:hypothetical protein